MKQSRRSWFPTRFFAVIGFLTTLAIVASIVAGLWGAAEQPSAPDNMVLTIDLSKPVVDQKEPSPLDLAMHEDVTSLLDIIHGIDSASTDPHVKGLAVTFGSQQPSLAQAQEIAAAVNRFRAHKKFTYAFAPSYGDYGQGNRSYYLASMFDEIWLQPVGTVGLTGIAVQAPFAREALSKIGVSGDFMQRKEYKSVMETFTRDEFSGPAREEMTSLVKNLSDQLAEGIARGRQRDIGKVEQLIANGPYTAAEALKAGLITHIGYSDEIDDEIKKKAGDDVEQVDISDYLSYPPHNGGSPKATVALIYGTGLITSETPGPSDIAGEKIMSADVVGGAFDAAAADDDVQAIIFRVDSPGGSPTASETIRRALVHAQKAGKPVFVSMGNVAASGGYWVSMNADYIAAEPATLTGSIGVVAGKFVMGGLWKKLGINWETLSSTDNARMWSTSEEFTPQGRERMNALLDDNYDAFVGNVSAARKIPLEKMQQIAKGRVWTGAQAVKLGLVDELGGIDVTWAAMRKKLNLAATDKVEVRLFPPPETPAEKVLKLLKNIGIESGMARVALVQLIRFQSMVRPVLGAIGSDPVTARLPAPIEQLAR